MFWIIIGKALILERVFFFSFVRFWYTSVFFYFVFNLVSFFVHGKTKNSLNLKQCGTYNRIQTLIVLLNIHKSLIPQMVSKWFHVQARLLLMAVTDLKEAVQLGVNLVFRKCVTCARFTREVRNWMFLRLSTDTSGPSLGSLNAVIFLPKDK